MMLVRFTTYNRSFMKQSFVGSQHQSPLIELLKLLKNTLSAIPTRWYNKKNGIYEQISEDWSQELVKS